MRQILLEKIIRESEQAALREQAASLLAASQPVAARAGQGGFLGGGRYGAPAQQPASGMKAFHQQHLQNQMLQVHPLGTLCPHDLLRRCLQVRLGMYTTCIGPYPRPLRRDLSRFDGVGYCRMLQPRLAPSNTGNTEWHTVSQSYHPLRPNRNLLMES